MDLNHARLAEYLKAARGQKDWRQEDAVSRAVGGGFNLSRRSIQRYENGEPFKQLSKARPTLQAFDYVYDWEPGSAEKVLLLGREPALAPQADVGREENEVARKVSFSSLPLRVRREFEENETLDTEIISIGRGGRMRLVLAVVRGEVGDDPEDLEAFHQDVREWERLLRALRQAADEGLDDKDADVQP